MSNDDSSSSGGSGCSCVGCLVFLFVFWFVFFGVSTPWGKFNIDIFPPRIWQMDKTEEPVKKEPVKEPIKKPDSKKERYF